MNAVIDKNRKRARRKAHIRIKIKGTQERPRISVFRSNLHFSAQVIDDINGVTLCSASSVEKSLSSLKNNVEDVKKLGAELGKRMLAKNIKSAVFDRNGYNYHGLVQAMADGVRESGVQF